MARIAYPSHLCVYSRTMKSVMSPVVSAAAKASSIAKASSVVSAAVMMSAGFVSKASAGIAAMMMIVVVVMVMRLLKTLLHVHFF